MVPFRQYAATALAAGEFPLWNPYTVGGMPFFAEIQTEVLYLPMLALTLFVKNGHLNVYWLELVNVLHYFLAACGMYLLARSFALRRMSALIAGTAFAFSGFMVTHAIHQVIIGVAAWYPLLLFMMRKALQEKRWTWVFVGPLTLGHSFSASSPQMSLFYFFLGIYVAVEIIATVGVRGLTTRPGLVLMGRAATLVGLSFAFIMVQLLPTQDLSALSQRATITYEKGSEGSLGWGQLLTLLVPKFFGASDAHGYNWWGPGAYWQYWETSISFGVAPLLFALFSLRFFRTNRHVAFFASFALFALLFSLGKNFFLHGLFFDLIPGFASFRNPGRMGVFVAFAGSMLAGFGFDAVLKGQFTEKEGKRWVTTMVWISGVCVAIVIAALLGLFDGLFPFLAQQQHTFVRRELRDRAGDHHPVLLCLLRAHPAQHARRDPRHPPRGDHVLRSVLHRRRTEHRAAEPRGTFRAGHAAGWLPQVAERTLPCEHPQHPGDDHGPEPGAHGPRVHHGRLRRSCLSA
ncbi:MAG: hypothetical protein IPI01_16550 [Ignavibacteriae bacterium]|nr:hypothetical protein [Ignavibacteriota bacterium]